MPWKIKRNYGGCKGYAVVKENGEIDGCHSTRASAINQQRALYAAEAEAKAEKLAKLWKSAIVPKRNNSNNAEL